MLKHHQQSVAQQSSAVGQQGQPQPASIRPQYAVDWSTCTESVQQCAEDAFTTTTAAGNPQQQQQQQCPYSIAAVISGCGQDAADVALAARRHLADALITAAHTNKQRPLVPHDLVAAFQQCHAQLLQAQEQPQQQTAQQQQQHPLNISHSGASCLLVCLDQDNKQLLAASAGLCHAVMARTAPGGAFTVLELSPRLALGYNVAETSRLDAEGSRICYSSSAAQQPACPLLNNQQQPHTVEQGGSSSSSSKPQQQQQQQQSSGCAEPVLIGPTGQALPGVRASRLLGYSSASAAGVLHTPVVTSWRLSGEEAFVVLGSPGLWDAMNPAEVVDYVAAVLASGACRVPQDEPTAAGTDAATAAASIPSADDQQTQRQIQQQLRPDAAVLLADLLTLEAQERLKLRLADLSTLLGLSGAAAGVASGSSTAASAHQHNTQVVPDVSAVVLLLPGPVLAGSQQLPVDQALLLEQLSQVSRGCRSNAEAQALQASWYSSAHASTCSSSVSVGAIPSSCSASSMLPSSMSSSADSTCSTGTSATALLPPARSNSSNGSSRRASLENNNNSSSAAAMAAAFTGIGHRQQGRPPAGAATCPAQSPPCPALSCLLPALTVAGHCWPSTFWPAPAAAVKVPVTGARSSSRRSLEAASRGQGQQQGDQSARPFDNAETAAAGDKATQPLGRYPSGTASRPVGFMLSPRLSLELDVTYRPGSSGSISSLAAQCAAADAAADAGFGSSSNRDPPLSPSSAEDQAVIVHKVRLSGPNELESLLFGNATTSHPDTTVARILRPKLDSSNSLGAGGSCPAGANSNTLAHAYSWAAPGGLSTSNSSLLGCYAQGSSVGMRQQQRASAWTTAGWAVAGAQRNTAHAAPRRSASVNIALLSRQLHGSSSLGGGGGGGSCSSSAASSQSHGSFRAGSFGKLGSRDSNSLAGSRPMMMATPPTAVAAAGGAALSGSLVQRQQLESVSEGELQQHAQHTVAAGAASLPACIPSEGRVSKARSYQALSALHAAGSAELSDSLAAAAAAAAAAGESTKSLAASVSAGGAYRPSAPVLAGAAASADAAGLLSRSSIGGAGGSGALYPQMQQQPLAFRPAFRSAVHSASTAALQHRFSDSAALVSEQEPQQPWRLSATGAADAAFQQLQQQQQGSSPGMSILARAASLADSQLSGGSCSELDQVPEGKVHGGLARSRSSSSQALTAAAAAAAAAAAGMGASSKAIIPGGSRRSSFGSSVGCGSSGSKGFSLAAAAEAATADQNNEADDAACADDDMYAASAAAADHQDGTQPPDQEVSKSSSSPAAASPNSSLAAPAQAHTCKEPSERCVRGGHTKVSRLTHSLSSPELSKAASSSGRVRRSSAVFTVLSTSSLTAQFDAQPQQQEQQDDVAASDAGVAAAPAVSPFAEDITGRSPSLSSLLTYASQMQSHQQQLQQLQQQQPQAAAVSAFAVASSCALSPAGSRELSESCYADGAVHGGELGEQALEGQMHGGRRSKSMSGNSLLLTSSLPSSAEDTSDNTLASSLSPGSRQQQMVQPRSGGLLKSSNSYGSTLSCSSSSWRQSALSPANSGALQGAVADSCVAETAATTTNNSSISSDISRKPSGSIEVVRMPSGSFTRVRFAASAPAAAAGEQLSTVVDAMTDSPASVLAGPGQAYGGSGSSATGLSTLLGGYSSSCGVGGTSAAPVSTSMQCWGSTSVKGWSSPRSQVVAFSSSAGSSDGGAALRGSASSSSMPGAASASSSGLGSNGGSPLPAAPRSAWSSSRAWSGKSASRKLHTGNNLLFGRANTGSAQQAGAAAGTPQAAALPHTAGDQRGAQIAGTAAAQAGTSGTVGGADAQVAATDAAAAAADTLLSAQLPSTKRQKSAPLPTLKEVPTPGSSPAVSCGFTAAYEETLARHLGTARRQQQQQQPAHGLGDLMVLTPTDTCEDEVTVGSVLSSLEPCLPLQQQLRLQQQQLQQQGSLPEHSATGLVVQSLTAEASRRSTDDSGSCSRSTPGCSSDGLGTITGAEAGGTTGSSSDFEFSRIPQQEGDAWEPSHSPLLGKIL